MWSFILQRRTSSTAHVGECLTHWHPTHNTSTKCDRVNVARQDVGQKVSSSRSEPPATYALQETHKYYNSLPCKHSSLVISSDLLDKVLTVGA